VSRRGSVTLSACFHRTLALELSLHGLRVTIQSAIRQSAIRTAGALFCGIWLSSCAAMDSGPINVFTERVGEYSPQFVSDPGDDGSLVVGLSFSGGGTRAAAFAFGVLRELDEAIIDETPVVRTVVDSIRMVSGTSGGAVAAAYFGYRGKDGYQDFRERFLLRDVEASLRTSAVSPVNLMRALQGGVNDRNGLVRWLDDNLFDGATFASFRKPEAPTIWLTASDIYNGTPFIFTQDTFAALCSDLDQVRLADAVAASAAVPVIFKPLVVAADSPECGYRQPAWLTRAIADPRTPLGLRAHARSLDTYRYAERLKHVQLLDGGLTDNIGVTGFALERAAAGTPYGPLSPTQAVRLRKLLFIVADAGVEATPVWGESAQGPSLAELVPALAHTTISSSVRKGFDALELAVANWRNEIVSFRCGLSSAEVRRYRDTLDGWNCRDVRITVEHLSFRNLAPETKVALDGVPTRFTLPEEQVDLVIAAGREAVRSNADIRDAVAIIQRGAGVRQRNSATH
jgi:predicted acylesterase/phospholipase RssA